MLDFQIKNIFIYETHEESIMLDFQLIGTVILIASIVLAFLMWYLTREILKMENLLLYSDIIFTILWINEPITSIVQAWEKAYYGTIFYYEWLFFPVSSASLALISYLMYIKKYLGFKKIKKNLN